MIIFHHRRHIDTITKEGYIYYSNGRPILERTLKLEELAGMNFEDLLKWNLEIYGKKLEITSKRHLGVALYDSC